jgi:hypothetical protein
MLTAIGGGAVLCFWDCIPTPGGPDTHGLRTRYPRKRTRHPRKKRGYRVRRPALLWRTPRRVRRYRTDRYSRRFFFFFFFFFFFARGGVALAFRGGAGRSVMTGTSKRTR